MLPGTPQINAMWTGGDPDLRGFELTDDPIQPDNLGLVDDPIESFGDEFEKVDEGFDVTQFALHGAPLPLEATLAPRGETAESSGYDPSHCDVDGYNFDQDLGGDQHVCTVWTPLPATFNEIHDHVGTQRRLEESLEPQRPKFFWEQDGFLGAVFGNGVLWMNIFRASPARGLQTI